MKSLLIVFLLAIVLALGIGQAFGQYAWTKYAGNPVIQPGKPGSWDCADMHALAVLFQDSVYHLYYVAWDNSGDFLKYKRTGYARSTDGIRWTKKASPVLDVGPAGAWDSWDAEGCAVLYDRGQYKMWYNGYWSSQWYQRIGYATGVSETTWTKRPNPILSPGSSGSWDDAGVMWACVLPASSGGGYRMWYSGFDGSAYNGSWVNYQEGYATAPNETTWTKYPSNPVLPLGPPGSWDDLRVVYGNVVYDSATSLYYMFYSGTGRNQGNVSNMQIGVATSSDGIGWTKYSGNPILSPGTSGSWDASYLVCGGVVVVRDTFRLWYRGLDQAGVARIGYATSPRVRVGVQHRVPQDYATIQAAIDASSDGDTVLVAEGTYKENIRYRGKAIVVGSRFLLDGDTTHIAKTIIDGSGSTKADSSSVVYFIEGEDTTSVLAGFTIRGGSGTNTVSSSSVWGTYRSYSGGGIFCLNAGARIVHNIIEKNRLVAPLCYGAGINAAGTASSHLILQGNQIRDNYVQATSTVGPQWGGAGGVSLAGVEARVVDNVVERDTVIGALGAFAGGIGLVPSSENQWPGGLFARNTIRFNVIRAALQGARGAGMMLMLTGQVTLDSNVFEGNSGLCTASNFGWAEGGGLTINDADITGYGRKILRNNKFLGNSISSSNSNDGAGLQLYYTLATVSGNEFSGNTVAGVGAGGGGGLSANYSSFRLENNIFVHNSSRLVGGALYVTGIPQSGTEQLVVNNTVVDNQATNAAGGMWVKNAPGLVTLNTIFWGDSAGTGAEIYVLGTAPTVQFCDVQGGYTGTGNIDADPRFMLPRLDALDTTSACIGAGVMASAPSTDIHGHPRPQPAGSAPDIGAEESYLLSPKSGVDEAPSLPSTFALSQNYPNPFNPSTVIKYTVGVASGRGQVASVRLTVFDLLGRQIATLVDEKKAPGSYEVTFDAGNLASGVYFYRMEAGTFADTKKLLLVR